MDPEAIQMLMQYMNAAKGGNRNISSIAGNLDNPILLALAGVLDPYYGQGGGAGGTTYGQFASDPSTPAAVKAVMDYVDQGMNSYQIEAAINTLDDNVIKDSGYTDQQLISMGREMVKEGGKKGTDVFSKAGLRNPNDVYTEADVPMTGGMLKLLENQQKRKKEFKSKAATIKSDLYKAERAANAAKDKQYQDFESGDAANMDWRYAAAGTYDAMRKEAGKNTKPQKRQPYLDYEYAQAKEEYEASVDAARSFDELEKAVRRGALRRVAEKGQTPFTDQTSTLLKFIAGTK
jgi:hypothetical protein